ncbi:MAG: hypothetical protein U1E65_31525 [Myxococcota bacterium]
MSTWLIATVAFFAGFAAMALTRYLTRGGLFTGGRVRIPRQFVVREIPTGDIPRDAQAPLDYLTARLAAAGFRPADMPVRVPALQSKLHRVVLVPFYHPTEQTLFIMGIDERFAPRAEIMLHILTPLEGGRRVETTTLSALEQLRPSGADVQIVTDANSVEEIWSRHRKRLMGYERKERLPIDPEAWKQPIALAYDAWVEAALRAQQLQLAADGTTYLLRSS